jgi:hypothetical protein
MVQAAQEDRKTKTRRTAGLDKVNESPNDFELIGLFYGDKFQLQAQFDNKQLGFVYCKPRYQVGDVMWVKETYTIIPPNYIVYKAETENPEKCKWKSSLFMRKEYSRIYLEVTNVHCERLQDITDSDALCEGIVPESNHKGEAYRLFVNLWEKINGKDSWLENPWVWVYTFKKFEHTFEVKLPTEYSDDVKNIINKCKIHIEKP